MDVELRKAAADDVPEIFNVETRCFSSPWSFDSIMSDISENECALYIVAEDGARVIGFCGMHTVLGEGHIMNIAVLEEYRGKGVGERLLKKMFELAPPYVANYTLEVRPSNTNAIRIYTKLGFSCFGMRPGYYEDTGESAMIMWLKPPGKTAL